MHGIVNNKCVYSATIWRHNCMYCLYFYHTSACDALTASGGAANTLTNTEKVPGTILIYGKD